MNAQGRTLRVVMLIAAIQLFFCILSAETIFNETMGAASTITEVPDYTGWYNYGSANYSGTADARSTWNSAGDYTGASGAGNIYFVGDMDDYYQISGINTSGYRNIRLSLALYKSNSNSTTGNAENGSNFNISYSVDSGISWRRLPITIPTGGSSTEIYYWRELSEYLPATDNLTLRFTNIGASEPVHFRMDDVTLNGDKDSILTETIGLGAANEEIALFNGWSNSSPITFSGSGYVRSDLPSTDKYTGATGGGNVLLDSGQYFQISGVNTLGYTQPALSVGVMKASAAENGSRLLMSYSTDGLVWSTPQLCTTTASGTNIWYRKHFSGLPLAGNLYLKFSNISSAGSSFRIDDIRLFSSLNAPVIGFPASYSISATGATLSANIGGLNGANVTQRGFYYSTTANFADGTGTVVTEAVSISQPGSYSLATGVLLPNTVYYYKAFATSSSGTSYSGQNTFTTLPVSTTTTFTLDNTLPTGGANFQTYGEAVTYLNANFAASSTGFTFLVKDGQEFADTSTSNYFITASGTAAKQIIFQRDNSGSTRPKLSRTSTSNNVVVLSGADWVTFDGIDVKVAGSYGFHLVNNGSSTTNGSQHNTIKNCTVTGGGTSTGSAGVSHTYSATPTSAAGKHSYNVFQNIAVKSIRNGIVLNGVASEIEISGCSITSIGSTSSCTGIKTTDITNLKVFNNLVNSLLTWFSFPIGINIASCKGNVDVYNNKISNLDGFYDETESLVFVAGIQVIPAAEESNIRIYNNMIWNLSDGYSGVSAEMSVRGIYIDSGYINGSLSIDYNTIRIPNNTRKAAGIRLSSPYANIRNNVISMNTTNQTYKVYGIYYDNLSQLNGVTDSNVIYLSNPALGCYIYANGTNYTLEGWQNTTGREAASWIYDPKLISTSNLHITPGADTPVESNASNYNGSISWVTHDIDGDLRNMSTPDIGADEGTFTFTIPQIPANPLSLTATAINAGEFIFSASANQAGNSILIAYNTSNTFGIPGGGYTAGATIQGGGTVAYMGNTQDLGLIPGFSPSTAYYFKAWSYATTDRTTYYLYSSGITITGSTPAPIAFPSVVTVNPSGSGTFNFNSLTQALHDIKLGIIPTGGITINIAPSYSETIISPMIIDITGTSTKPITIQKDTTLNGVNPRFTRVDSGSINPTVMGGYGDSVIRIDGSDYLTISGIDVFALDSGIEYGYLTHKPSATNGSQYLNIRNCEVSMNKGNSPYVIGIYIGNGTTDPASQIGYAVTSASGKNRFVDISQAMVHNVHTGIRIQGSAASGFYDSDISLGLTAGTNEISDFGGVSDSPSYGVAFFNVSNSTVNNTIIHNYASPAKGNLYGIYFNKLAGALDGAVRANNNNIWLANTSAKGWTYWIDNNMDCNSETITNNIFTAGEISSNGSAYLIDAANHTANKTITGNATQGTITLTGDSAGFSCYNNSQGDSQGFTWVVTEIVSNNNFSNIIATGNSQICGISATDSSPGTKTISNNTLSNWSTQGNVAGIDACNIESVQINNNSISNITASRVWWGIVYRGSNGSSGNVYNNLLTNITMTGPGLLTGIEQGSTFETSNCYNNKLSSMSATHPEATVVGFNMSANSTLTSIYNNMIYGLSAVGGNTASDTPTVTGIKYGGSGVGNIFYNTVYLFASSTAAGFSSAALYHDITSDEAVTGTYSRIRNNIFVNKSVPGSLGRSVAFWKATSGSTAMGASSDRNIYYAGEPDANNLIAYLGTTACSTMNQYKAAVSTVDQASFTEDVPFVSPNGTIDVHINPNIPTYVQNQGTAISGFTTDIDGQTRHSTTPDIGADEGNFTIAPTCVAPIAQPTNLILVPNHNSISVSFTPSLAEEYLVLRHTASAPSAAPVNGTFYWPGQTLGNATIVSSNEATACLATGLSSSTQYYISVYAYNSYGLSAPKYRTTSPLRLAVTTLSASHNQPSAFTATAINATSIALSASPNAAGDNIIVAYSYSPNFGTPLGNYSVGSAITGGGTILYMGSAAGLNSHTGLYPWTRFYYKAWSYYSINRAIYYSYSDGVIANAKTSADPFVGIRTINPNILGANNFISISEALAALNYAGVNFGGVTFNIVAGYVDTLSAPLVFSASGNESSPIVFQKDPATTGANPLIVRNDEGLLATTVLGGNGDSIIRIEGSDFLTLDGIDVQSQNSAIEYGYFATKPSETNGSQHLSIKNCNINMIKAYSKVVGIYISNGPTSVDNSSGVNVTAPSGQNSNVTITGATIRNTSYGILLIGSSATGYPDTDYTIGAEGAGNIIEDYLGYLGSGINVKYVNNPSICYNSLNNAAGGGTDSPCQISGIILADVSGEISVNYNYVNLLVRDSFNAHASMAWISNTGTGSRESYIGNTFGAGYNFSIGLECYFIYLWNNTPIRIVSDNSTPDVGVHISLGRPYGYYSYSDAISGTETVTNNSFTNFKGSWVWGIHIRSNRGGGTICSGNTISGLSGQSVVGIYLDTESTVPSVISNNTISNLTGTYNGVKGIEVSTGVTEIHGNVIDNFAGTASIFYGISQDWGSSICSNNVVTNLNGQYSNTVVRGIRIMCNAEIHNNIIHSLSALGGTYNFSYPDLAAIETGNTPAKLYYNSVLLNSSGTGNTFSSAGLFLGASSHDLRNNSIVNKCTPGNNGRTVAVWRSTGQPMVATSNNNIYYAGVISTSAPYLNMIGYMSGEVKSTLASYQASVFPAEQNSYTEDVPYLSSTEPVDLHINPGIATYIESRAMPIAGYETDSDGQTRNSITPDIGAYEGDYTPNLPPLPASSPSPADLATAQLTDISLSWSRSPGGAAPTSYNVYFGTTNPPTLIGNQAATTYNPGVLAINQTYYWKIDPANSYGVASTTNTVPVWSFTTHNPLPEAAVLVSPSNQATGIAINPSFSWSAGTGFAPLGYKLYLGTDNPPTNVMNGTDLGNVTSYAYPGGRQGNAIRSNNPTDKANPNLFKTELDAMLSRNALNYNTTYHWKVVPYTIAGSALNNAVWSFATELAPVPLAAVNPLPSDLATAVILNPELSWSPNPEGTLPDSYKVYFGTTNPPQLIGSQAGATYTPANLTYSTTYYWKIDPHSERGYASQNNTLPVWSFTTENSLYPTQVVLVSPANGSTGSNTGVSLNWSAGAGATPSGYRISLGTNNPPTNILNGLDLGNVTTCNPAGLLANTTYYWQVVAYNSLGDSAPATVWSFTVPTQEVSIGNGTGTNRSPFGTSYGYERDATLYLASEIGSISQPIRSLAWYATRAVSTATPVKIYLKATTATALPSVNWTSTISGASLVYNSSISSIAANAWMNINLSSAFTLPSGSNLMVLIETNYGGSGNGNFNGGGFRNTSLSPVNTRHKYWMGNTTPPTSTGSFDILRANIRLSSFSSTMALPNPAVVSAPLSGANGVALNSSLNWNSGGGTVTGFKLYLGTDGNGSSTPTNMVYGQDLGYCFSYTPAVSLAYNTTYYWQVILYNSDGIASGSSIWSFTTMQEPSLSLSAPTNLAISIQEDTVELSWDEVPEATSYAIYAADSPNPDDWGDEIAVVNITHYYTAVTNRCFFRVVARN